MKQKEQEDIYPENNTGGLRTAFMVAQGRML
jgi:hypothetical protein